MAFRLTGEFVFTGLSYKDLLSTGTRYNSERKWHKQTEKLVLKLLTISGLDMNIFGFIFY